MSSNDKPRALAGSSSTARRHHYVPVFVLQGFTRSGRRRDFLWVHDREEQKCWQAKPDQAAVERDYYRVDIPGIEPNIVETMLAEVEGRAAVIVQEMSRDRELPLGENLEVLILFVALLALRTPSVRGLAEKNTENLYKKIAQVIVSRPEPFEQYVSDLKKEGKELPPELTYEAVRDFVERGAYRVRVSRTESVKTLLASFQGILPAFFERRWSLLFTRPSEACLICSDMPVSIASTVPDSPLNFLGFGSKMTELTVPLSRSIALVGSYEAPSKTAEIPLEFVRLINQRTVSFAERFLYSTEENFVL